MPSQLAGPTTPEWTVGDTAPPLVACLSDGDGNPIDLSGATVTINIAFGSWSYYYAPQRRLVSGGACVVDPDQSEGGNRGFVSWSPLITDLIIAGDFRYTFHLVHAGGGVQTVAPNAANAIVIRPPVGGMQYA
jgi:hypothetical protein